MWFFKKSKKGIFSPTNGRVMDLSTLKDGVFSEKMMGDGFVATLSDDGSVYSPITGKIVVAFPTKHAYGIETKNGLNVLVHIGIDTVNLEGEGFETFVVQDQMIKQGELLAKVDKNVLKRANLITDVVVVITPESKLKAKANSIKTNFNATTNDVVISEFEATI